VCKTLFGSLKTIFPDRRRGDRIFVQGGTATSDELTGNPGIAIEDTSIGDGRLVAHFAKNR
jgi:hypothetical protein